MSNICRVGEWSFIHYRENLVFVGTRYKHLEYVVLEIVLYT